MNILDGKLLSDEQKFSQWKCEHDHVMGVIQRVRETLVVNGKSIRYHTSQLLLFREAVDMTADVPAEIDVAGKGNGKILSIVWRCSICDATREWHVEPSLAEWVAATYLSE